MDEIKKTLSDYDGLYGFSSLTMPLHIQPYIDYLENGYHADMDYLKQHLNDKSTPQNLLKEAKSAIVFQKNYLPHHPSPKKMPEGLKIASYAKGEDYHHCFKAELHKYAKKLKTLYPNEEFLCFTDSAPVLERDLAVKAGLGWIGKNSCLIHPKKGSFSFIGEIYTTLELSKPEAAALPDRCGNCRKCIEACPTNAITEDRKVDSNKCISYWSIESKSVPPLEIREKMEGWYFGCDICQEVCPWNQKAFGKEFFIEKAKEPDFKKLENSLKEILSASNRNIERIFQGTALLRAGARKHRQNAILTCVHYKRVELLPEIKEVAKKHPALKDLCDWAVEILSQ